MTPGFAHREWPSFGEQHRPFARNLVEWTGRAPTERGDHSDAFVARDLLREHGAGNRCKAG